MCLAQAGRRTAKHRCAPRRVRTPLSCGVCAQATRTGDPLVIRQAQANIAARRAGLRTPLGATPGPAGTPSFSSVLRTPAGLGHTPMATPVFTPRPGGGDALDRHVACREQFLRAC